MKTLEQVNMRVVVVVVVVVVFVDIIILDNILEILVTSADSNINTTVSLNDVILEINDKSFESELDLTQTQNSTKFSRKLPNFDSKNPQKS